jgi:nicotinamide mononucleotide (NMN) deamidase PncC
MNAPLDDAHLFALGNTIAELLIAHGQTIVTAESCTGGWIAKVLTDIPGSSTWFECGVVAYSYEAKEALLGVQPLTLERTGAVSQDTVVEMVGIASLARSPMRITAPLPNCFSIWLNAEESALRLLSSIGGSLGSFMD